jgi:hypothetical protein
MKTQIQDKVLTSKSLSTCITTSSPTSCTPTPRGPLPYQHKDTLPRPLSPLPSVQAAAGQGPNPAGSAGALPPLSEFQASIRAYLKSCSQAHQASGAAAFAGAYAPRQQNTVGVERENILQRHLEVRWRCWVLHAFDHAVYQPEIHRLIVHGECLETQSPGPCSR